MIGRHGDRAVLFHDVWVFDGTGAARFPGSVLVRGNRIDTVVQGADEIDAPDADGAVVLDFNRAVNLPCAYTDHATCPLPPAGNRLPVGIEAGEKTPIERNVA